LKTFRALKKKARERRERMYNGGKIIAGLIIFFGLVTVPFYSNFGKTAAKVTPKLDNPVINQLEKKECVKPKEYMWAEHMKVLDEWRDEVVREGKRGKMIVGGIEIERSLQNGCLKCHSNVKTFCDVCHTAAGVKPYCWDCHFINEEGQI